MTLWLSEFELARSACGCPCFGEGGGPFGLGEFRPDRLFTVFISLRAAFLIEDPFRPLLLFITQLKKSNRAYVVDEIKLKANFNICDEQDPNLHHEGQNITQS